MTDDTALAPSEDTIIAPTCSAAEAPTPLAWSADDADTAYPYPDTGDITGLYEEEAEDVWTDEQDRRYAWGTVVMFAGFMAIVALAAAVTVWATHRAADTMPVAAPSTSQTVVPPVAAPSPDDQVVPAPSVAAPAPPPPYTATDDQRFLNHLQELGYTIQDRNLALDQAHNICNQYRAGKTPQQVQDWVLQQMGGIDAPTGMQVISTATLSYPDCG